MTPYLCKIERKVCVCVGKCVCGGVGWGGGLGGGGV